MLDRLEQIEARYQGLARQMADPAVLGDHAQYQKLAKQHRDLEPVVEKFREYRTVKAGIADARGMLNESDAEIRAMAQEELTALEARAPQIEEDLKLLLLPKDPTMRRTWCWRFARGRAAMRLRCLPARCSGCTRDLRSSTGGRWRCCRRRSRRWAD